MKQTAVEWLIEQLCGEHTDAWKEEIKQALELEKQQIKYAYNQGYRDGGDEGSGKDISLFDDANLYYNDTYKKP
jgi:predicted secreted protein